MFQPAGAGAGVWTMEQLVLEKQKALGYPLKSPYNRQHVGCKHVGAGIQFLRASCHRQVPGPRPLARRVQATQRQVACDENQQQALRVTCAERALWLDSRDAVLQRASTTPGGPSTRVGRNIAGQPLVRGVVRRCSWQWW